MRSFSVAALIACSGGASAGSGCGVDSYPPSLLDPAVAAVAGRRPAIVVGGGDNLRTPAALDLGGVWWIRYFPLPGETLPSWDNAGTKIYASTAFEELVTFADASTNSSQLPAHVGLAYNREHHWGYTDTIWSYLGRLDNAADPVDTRIDMFFYNATHGYLLSADPDDHWDITRLDKDRWRRDTIFGPSSVFPGNNASYILTRVLMEDGTPHPIYYDAFQAHMGWMSLRVHGTDDLCLRTCGAIAPQLTCAVKALCNGYCGIATTDDWISAPGQFVNLLLPDWIRALPAFSE